MKKWMLFILCLLALGTTLAYWNQLSYGAASEPKEIGISSTPVPWAAGLTVYRDSGIRDALSVAFHPTDKKILYVGARTGLFRSTDGGSTWTLISADLLYAKGLVVDWSNPDILYAHTVGLEDSLPQPGIYKSTDGGLSWHINTNGIEGQAIYSLAQDPQRPSVLYVGGPSGKVYRSTDGGKTFTQINQQSIGGEPPSLPSAVKQILISTPEHIYAVTSLGVYLSTDGGISWSRITLYSGHLALDSTTGVLYLGGRKVQRSSDGGRSWDDISGNLPCNIRHDTCYVRWVGVNEISQTLYVQYSMHSLYRSTDNGETWERLPTASGGPFIVRAISPGPAPAIYGIAIGTLARYIEKEN